MNRRGFFQRITMALGTLVAARVAPATPTTPTRVKPPSAPVDSWTNHNKFWAEIDRSLLNEAARQHTAFVDLQILNSYTA